MKIVISHVYSTHNNGDAAILSAQLDQLRQTFPQAQFRILSVENIEANYKFDGVPVSNALMFGTVSPANSRPKKLMLAVMMMATTTVWAMVFRLLRIRLPLPKSWRVPMRIMSESDLQVCVGGGYLRAKNDLISTLMLLLLFHQIWLARTLGKPVVLYAQSFGPYPKRIQYKLAAAGLRYATLILVREANSRDLLARMGLADDRVIQVPDSAFLFTPNLRFNPWPLIGERQPAEQIVGITARAWLPGAGQYAYERAVAEFIERLSRQPGVKVVVIPQVTATDQNDDDRAVGRRIQELVGGGGNVVFLDRRFTHYEIKSVFACLDYLVGTRFHSVIFALTENVPALAIEYEHKTSGIMRDLGLEDWVLAIEDVTADRLASLFARLMRERDDYLRQLHKVLPDYIASARASGNLIKEAYERSVKRDRPTCHL
jgi:colanic acid/amylovoran biosynthesis protein